MAKQYIQKETITVLSIIISVALIDAIIFGIIRPKITEYDSHDEELRQIDDNLPRQSSLCEEVQLEHLSNNQKNDVELHLHLQPLTCRQGKQTHGPICMAQQRGRP